MEMPKMMFKFLLLLFLCLSLTTSPAHSAVRSLRVGTPLTITRTTPGVTDWIKVNHGQRGAWEISMAIAGENEVGLLASVEYTFFTDPDNATANMIIEHKHIKAVTSYEDDKLEWPPYAVRMRVDTITGGQVHFIVIQPGTR